MAETHKNICPYPGLRPFNEHESLFFKGRDMHISKLSEQLEQKKFLMVTGASGDGKSSLVYAGLIPKIKAGFFKAQFNNWKMAIFRPANNPFNNLVNVLSEQLNLENSNLETTLKLGYSALADIYRNSDLYFKDPSKEQKKKAANLLIVVDQFEEFFTNKENFNRETAIPSVSAQNVVNLLIETAKIAEEENLPIYILCTMRSDFIGNAPAFRGLPEFIGDHQYFVPRLTRDEIYQVITEPATLSGNRISQRLAQRMLNDLNIINTDILPVLQHALKQIWIKADRGEEEMDLVHYAMVGGMPKNELQDEDQVKFQVWFDREPFYIEQFYKDQSLNNVLNIHANSLFMQTHDYVNRHTHHRYTYSKREARELLQKILKCFTKIDDSKAVRNRMTVQEIADIIGEEDVYLVVELLNIFREESNNLIYPFMDDTLESRKLQPDVLLDITHEALIRNWRLLSNLTKEEHNSSLEFKEVHSHILRWLESRKEDNQLLSGGGYDHFKNWFDKQQPNGAWITRYLENEIYKSDGIMIKPIEKLMSVNELIEGEERIDSSADENDISNESQIAEAICIFLNKSHEQIEKRKRSRKRTITIISTLAIIASVAFIWAFVKRQEAVDLKDEIASRAKAIEVATKAYRNLEGDPTLAFRLAEQSYAIYRTTLAKQVLMSSYENIPFYNKLTGHTGSVGYVEYSPDGEYIISSSTDGTARLWDKDGNLKTVFTGHNDGLIDFAESARFSPNGKYILTYSTDSTARLWNLVGKCLNIMHHNGSVHSACYSPNGLNVMTAASDNTVRIWDLAENKISILKTFDEVPVNAIYSPQGNLIIITVGSYVYLYDNRGNQIKKLSKHNDKIISCNFSKNGAFFATGSVDGTAILWTRKGDVISKLIGLDGRVRFIGFAKNDSIIVTSTDHTVQIWNNRGVELKNLQDDKVGIKDVKISHDGKYIITGGHERILRVWNFDGQVLMKLKGHSSSIHSCNFSPDLKYVASSSWDKTVRIWNIDPQEKSQIIGHSSKVRDACFSPDGKNIASVSWDKTARIWDRQGKLLALVKVAPGEEIAISADNNSFAVTNPTKYLTSYPLIGGVTARIWDFAGNELLKLENDSRKEYRLYYSPNSEDILINYDSRIAELWNIAGNKLQSFSKVQNVAFSRNGKYLLSIQKDSIATVWGKVLDDTIIFKPKFTLEQHNGSINTIESSPDENMFVTASADGSAILWNQFGEVSSVLRGHDGVVYTATFSPNGEYIVTVGRDHNIIIWNTNGNMVAKLIGHSEEILEIDISPDSRYIVSGSYDHTVRLWDFQGNQKQIYTSSTEKINSVQFSPDSKYILSASNDFIIRVLPISVEVVLDKINKEEVCGKVYVLNEQQKKVFGITE
ncbi:WD40 repeat domain-containing protein [Cytophagaceae bacterium AH-315-L13]|nr:WD40 repeat domain-containing protein [Cytophagaceae bacterium AH-315-L13]